MNETRLNELIDRWEELREHRASPTLQALCGDRPDLVDEMEQRIAALGQVDVMLGGFEDTNPDQLPDDHDAHAPASPTVLPALSAYTGLRFHARGGLGEVFRARDERLGRDVALKVIRAERGGSMEGCRRFERESEITGWLDHPGVAPVHASGRCDDGRPFYVMRFIEGETLGDAIGRFHADDPMVGKPGERAIVFRGLVNRFVQVCDTIDYAHGRGVIHRDIKPSNVMLGPHGGTLVVDWGLAKILGETGGEAEVDGSSKPSDPGLTAAGSTLGTPAFMAPEQVAGDPGRLSPDSDVYSLGATLYCLITGKPAFEGKDLADIQDRVRRGDFPKPSEVKREISRSLEAICLKAMALKPDERYRSAGGLGRELERWLADEPVTAYHEGWTGWIGRWGRRHRSVVAASLLVLLTAVIALSVTSIQISKARVASEAARKRAVANGFMILQGITEPLKKLGNPDLEQHPELASMRRSALAQAIEAYETFVKSRGPYPDEAAEALDSLIHLGLIHTIGADREKAMETYRRALAMGDQVLVRNPGASLVRDSLGMAHFHLGMELLKKGHNDEAEEHFRAAETHFVRSLEIAPNNLFCRQHLAWLLAFSPDGQFLHRTRAVKLALGILELPDAQGRDRASFSEGIRPKFTEGLAYYRAGMMASARAALEESIKRRDGGDAYEWFVMALVAACEGKDEAAIREYERAIEWTKWNRYSDTELHMLEAGAAKALGRKPAFGWVGRAFDKGQ